MGNGITEKEAVDIALADAKENYVDLNKYKVHAALSGDVWMIDLEPNDPADIGGASYLIASGSGAILKKRYI